MALIRVNDEEQNRIGTVSFDRDALYNEDGKVIGQKISGILATHDYIEEVYKIETERYLLKDVSVFRESFASNEFFILYYFQAEDLTVKQDNISDDISWLMEEEIVREEKSNKEWFHSYLNKEAIERAEEIIKEIKEANENEED